MLVCIHASKVIQKDEIPTTIRANTCVLNATHCHCALVAANASSICLKPMSGTGTMCKKGSCAAGYRCDCESNAICAKGTVTSYVTTDISQGISVRCSAESKTVPRTIVGYTSDFHIVAYQEFQLFVNGQQIGYGDSNEYKVLTGEIASGDVIAVSAKRRSLNVYGVKLRFVDLQNEIRVIDENWYASSTYQASWLEKSFDPVNAGWTTPTNSMTVSEDGFDKNCPWMWKGISETVYFRYVIP